MFFLVNLLISKYIKRKMVIHRISRVNFLHQKHLDSTMATTIWAPASSQANKLAQR